MKESGTDNYYVFFKSNELEAVKTIIQESYKDYLNERKQQAERNPEREKTEDKKKDSVREKLKKNHEKVHNSEEPDRHHNREERSR